MRSLAFHASACDQLRAETLPDQNGYSVSTWREPHGVTGHLLPWKNPLRTFGRSVGGALAAGNVCVVKPAEDASLALLRVAELAAEAGFPPGVVNIVTGYGHEAGDALARHRGIGHISFTGSPKTGTLVQQVAAERHCPVTLTLGGHSPQIVFADADLDRAVPALIGALLYNAGQTGAAGARVLIAQAIYEPLLDRLGAAFEALRVGPAGMDLHMGPLIRQSQQQRVWDFLSDAHVAGIAMVAQGVVVDEAPESGFYQAPTLLRDVPLLQAMALETVPGPVLAATPFADEDHAVALANAAPHTSMAHLWTRDAPRQLRLAQGLRCGRVAVNDHGGEEREGGFSPWAVPGPAESLDAVLAFTTLKTLAVRGI